MQEKQQSHPLSRRSIWPMAIFLASFTALLIFICYIYLFPALEATKTADPEQKSKLRAWATLLEAVLLFILFAGLVLTVRFGRFFFPRPDSPRVKTQHVDVWAEAGKRVALEKPDEESDDKK